MLPILASLLACQAWADDMQKSQFAARQQPAPGLEECRAALEIGRQFGTLADGRMLIAFQDSIYLIFADETKLVCEKRRYVFSPD